MDFCRPTAGADEFVVLDQSRYLCTAVSGDALSEN